MPPTSPSVSIPRTAVESAARYLGFDTLADLMGTATEGREVLALLGRRLLVVAATLPAAGALPIPRFQEGGEDTEEGPSPEVAPHERVIPPGFAVPAPGGNLPRPAVASTPSRKPSRKGVSSDQAIRAELAESVREIDPTRQWRPSLYKRGFPGYQSIPTLTEDSIYLWRTEHEDSRRPAVIFGWQNPVMRDLILVKLAIRSDEFMYQAIRHLPEGSPAARFPALVGMGFPGSGAHPTTVATEVVDGVYIDQMAEFDIVFGFGETGWIREHAPAWGAEVDLLGGKLAPGDRKLLGILKQGGLETFCATSGLRTVRSQGTGGEDLVLTKVPPAFLPWTEGKPQIAVAVQHEAQSDVALDNQAVITFVKASSGDPYRPVSVLHTAVGFKVQRDPSVDASFSSLWAGNLEGVDMSRLWTDIQDALPAQQARQAVQAARRAFSSSERD